MKVLLLDAYNLMYRARYSFRPPSKGNEEDYGTIYSFFRSLRPLIEKFAPDKVYFVLDGAPKMRLLAAPDYKGTRVYHDDDGFHAQRRIIIEMMKEYFPIDVVRHEDYECDDLIANIIDHWHPYADCTIISSDSDFIQMLDTSDHVKLYNPVTKKYRHATSYDYVKWKSLRGDASDNIEGFRGIGPKRAEALSCDSKKLQEFLDRQPDGHQKYNHNFFMVKFHDMSEVLDDVIMWTSSFKHEIVRDQFTEMKFFSMVNSKSWKKFKDTFECIPFTSAIA